MAALASGAIWMTSESGSLRPDCGAGSSVASKTETAFRLRVIEGGSVSDRVEHGPSERYTRAEAAAYRRLWGADPLGYTEWEGRWEEERRETVAHGARHAMCSPGLSGRWRCKAIGPGSDCGNIKGA